MRVLGHLEVHARAAARAVFDDQVWKTTTQLVHDGMRARHLVEFAIARVMVVVCAVAHTPPVRVPLDPDQVELFDEATDPLDRPGSRLTVSEAEPGSFGIVGPGCA